MTDLILFPDDTVVNLFLQAIWLWMHFVWVKRLSSESGGLFSSASNWKRWWKNHFCNTKITFNSLCALSASILSNWVQLSFSVSFSFWFEFFLCFSKAFCNSDLLLRTLIPLERKSMKTYRANPSSLLVVPLDLSLNISGRHWLYTRVDNLTRQNQTILILRDATTCHGEFWESGTRKNKLKFQSYYVHCLPPIIPP